MTGCDGKDYPECKYKKELKNKESKGMLIGVDYAKNGDYGCETTFKVSKNGKMKLIEVNLRIQTIRL
jgi:hypothetical protein